MQFIIFWLTSYILIANTFIQGVDTDSLDNDQSNLFLLKDDTPSNLNINPDLGDDNDLWTSDLTTNFIDADNHELIFNDDLIASSIACSPSSSSTLKRLNGRDDDGDVCSTPNPPGDVKEQNPPQVKIRPLGTTQDWPLLYPTYNLEICDAQVMGVFHTIPACDSGREEDRKPTTDAGVYNLEHCTPCMYWTYNEFPGLVVLKSVPYFCLISDFFFCRPS